MRAQPEATVFSVSQNDTDLHCECPRCQALARQEGSQGAPVLNLANRVAEAVEKEFPGKAVETLAYQWTRQAPKTMRPRPNVIVRLCSIECCFSHPLATCDSRENRAFRDDLRAWSKVAQRLWIWDYTTDFAHYLLPFPNQRVRRPNIRFFVANHVKGIFEAGHLRHAPQRIGRPGRLSDGQVPLEPGLRSGSGDRTSFSKATTARRPGRSGSTSTSCTIGSSGRTSTFTFTTRQQSPSGLQPAACGQWALGRGREAGRGRCGRFAAGAAFTDERRLCHHRARRGRVEGDAFRGSRRPLSDREIGRSAFPPIYEDAGKQRPNTMREGQNLK